jgi:hypothetical protein
MKMARRRWQMEVGSWRLVVVCLLRQSGEAVRVWGIEAEMVSWDHGLALEGWWCTWMDGTEEVEQA